MLRRIYFTILIFTVSINLPAQDLKLESFDHKKTISSWRIVTNGQIFHSDQYTFKGKTFFKQTKDSFLLFRDTGHHEFYKVNVSKKFKAIKANAIVFHFSLFSEDTFNDYLTFGFHLRDVTGKKTYSYEYYSFSTYDKDGAMSGASFSFVGEDSIWKKADSLEVYFSFYPYNTSKKVERLVVIDGITLQGVTTGVKHYSDVNFEPYPNPTTDFINLQLPKHIQPKYLSLLDYTGRELYRSQDFNYQRPQIDVRGYQSGFYFLYIKFENGETMTRKIEIK